MVTLLDAFGQVFWEDVPFIGFPIGIYFADDQLIDLIEGVDKFVKQVINPRLRVRLLHDPQVVVFVV